MRLYNGGGRIKVLADYHHGNLYNSFHMLFEERLGYELYRPIGMDWLIHGFFKIAEPYGNARDTVDQYLAIDNREWDAYKRLNGNYRLEDDVYHIYDRENGFTHKAITLSTFRKMQFDLVIASYPSHGDWKELLKFQPNAKFVMQLGNEGQNTDAANVLCSTTEFLPKENQRVYYYHQEFDLSDYRYEPPISNNKISSFVVLLPERERFIGFKKAMPEYDWKAYGPGAIDGIMGDGKGISTEMRKSAFGYHNKPQGDGFGHVIHKFYASGRPCIVNYGAYAHRLAGKLLIPDVTCINLDEPFDTVCKKIRFFSRPSEHKKMCKAAYVRFKEVVDFDREAKEIKDWLRVV